MFIKHFVKFATNTFQHCSDGIKFLFKNCSANNLSVFGRNVIYCQYHCGVTSEMLQFEKVNYNVNIVVKICREGCKTSDAACIGQVIRELAMIRDGQLELECMMDYDDIINLLHYLKK